MKWRFGTGWVMLALLGGFTVGFQNNGEEIAEEIRIGVQMKVDQFIARKTKDCRDRAIREAQGIVDSLIRAEAFIDQDIKLDRPERPERPEKPEIKTLTDSSAIDPLFDQ